MEVNYSTPTDPALLDPVALGDELSETFHSAMRWLARLSEAQAATPVSEGKWAPKQIIGHLIDSAVNNLNRFVRMQIGPEPLPTYGSDDWVTLQHYAEREWSQILQLWLLLNEHLAWTIRHVEKANLTKEAPVGGTFVSLGFIIEDYIAHMRHHLIPLAVWAEVLDIAAG